MPDYTTCMIYKLICDDDPTFLYIGHTTNWNRRKASHKSRSSLNDTKQVYQKIRELGGWGNIKMIWIEDYPCNNKREGEAREQHWMDILKSNMNTHRAFVTEEQRKECSKERYENNKEAIKERYENNKEAIAEYHKEWYENNKEAIREQQKYRYENNKEAILEKNKAYHEANKETIAAKQAVQFECECGGKYARNNKARHFRSKLHQDWLLKCGEVQVD